MRSGSNLLRKDDARSMIGPTDTYRRNLSALRGWQAPVADLIDRTDIPDGVTRAAGRDQCDTFLTRSPDGKVVWFGRSSMPTISAPETMARFSDTGRNVILPGIMTGHEPLVALQHMASHCAVFIVERDPLQLKLAMHLCNYVDALDARRLVLIVGEGDALIDGFRSFFERNPGFELPLNLFPLPQSSVPDLAALQTWIERAGQVVTEIQARVVASQVKKLADKPNDPTDERRCVAVLSTDPSPAALQQASRVVRAFGVLGTRCSPGVPDRPDRCHVSVRLGAIVDHHADAVLFINSGAEALRALLPARLPITSWYAPGALIPKNIAEALSGDERFLAASLTVRDGLISAGVGADAIALSPPAAQDGADQPDSTATGRASPADDAVTVIADVFDDSADACNLKLTSHRALWAALHAVVERYGVAASPDRLTDYLHQAQRASGVKIGEQAVLTLLTEWAMSRLLPAAVTRATVRRLLRTGRRVTLWGQTGLDLQHDALDHRGPVPPSQPLHEILTGSRLLVLPTTSPTTIQTALDALALGKHVIVRRPDVNFETEYPGLTDVAVHLNFYATESELNKGLRQVDAHGGGDGPGDAVTLVRTRHTVSARLKHLFGDVREHSASSSLQQGS